MSVDDRLRDARGRLDSINREFAERRALREKQEAEAEAEAQARRDEEAARAADEIKRQVREARQQRENSAVSDAETTRSGVSGGSFGFEDDQDFLQESQAPQQHNAAAPAQSPSPRHEAAASRPAREHPDEDDFENMNWLS